MEKIFNKYNIHFINGNRYYLVCLDDFLLLDNTIPYLFEYNGYKIYETAWNRITVKILEYIDKLNPKDTNELLNLKYTWSKQKAFSKDKKTNHLPLKRYT